MDSSADRIGTWCGGGPTLTRYVIHTDAETRSIRRRYRRRCCCRSAAQAPAGASRRVHQAGVGVTKALPFTVAAIARAIEGARKAGLQITATSVNPDTGVITIHHQEVPLPTVPKPGDQDGGDWTDA